jgi:hypothetical protein
MGTHEATATTSSTQKATVAAVVRRFQGRYECGCTVDRDIPQPTECVNHGAVGVYEVEPIEIENVEIGEDFDDFVSDLKEV